MGDDAKVVKAPRGKSTLGPAKTTIDRTPKPCFWIKVFDTTGLGDADTEPHVAAQQVAQKLEERFKWLPGVGIDLKVEVGQFTAAEVKALGPETRNQILLANVGVHKNGRDKPVQYHPTNVSNLVQAMLDLEALPDANPFEERSLAQNLNLWPTLQYLAYGTYFGVTRDNTRVSTVEFWDASLRTADQNEDAKEHPAEWEAHVSEHEIGHTFLGPDHTPEDRNFPNVMEGGFWEYNHTATLDRQAVNEAGGARKLTIGSSHFPTHRFRQKRKARIPSSSITRAILVLTRTRGRQSPLPFAPGSHNI
jgi:hypothetical protein